MVVVSVEKKCLCIKYLLSCKGKHDQEMEAKIRTTHGFEKSAGVKHIISDIKAGYKT